LLALPAIASLARADDLVAVADLKFLKETERVVSASRLGESDDDCVPRADGHLFEGRVSKSIYGDAPKDTFPLICGHHAMYRRVVSGIVGRLSKPTDGIDGTE
jgi:hypothetical protein